MIAAEARPMIATMTNFARMTAIEELDEAPGVAARRRPDHRDERERHEEEAM